VAIRVLVVDDEIPITKFISQYLTLLGYEIQCSNDPRQALELAKSFRPALCIVDINMPYVSGPKLFKALKAYDPSIEVILVTAVDDTQMAVNLMRQGAADYLLKPIQLQDLEQALSKAAEHRQLLRENVAYKLHLELLVTQRSTALDEALHQLSRIHNATLETLAMALDFRDEGTSGHSRRVAEITLQIARVLGAGSEELIQVKHGALLHDIGKLRIPDRILRKPTELSPDEWEIMRMHPEWGYEFVSHIDFLVGAADIVLSHHEKFDGSGYPRGLKGTEISLGARIFAIVDAMDAMIYDRPYHCGISFTCAREKVVKLAGTHFDPELIEPALLQIERFTSTPADQLSFRYGPN